MLQLEPAARKRFTALRSAYFACDRPSRRAVIHNINGGEDVPGVELVVLVTVTFFLAGTVKGVIGLGLPTVSLAVLTAASDLPTAMSLLLFPSFLTNLWQAMTGGEAQKIIARTWPFLVAAVITIPVGALALDVVRLAALSGLLGILIVAYATIGLGGFCLNLSPVAASRSGPLFGVANGILTGMTGSFVVPGVMYLQALGLPRDAFVQAMGILFTLSTLVLGLALARGDILLVENVYLSAFAILPAVAGMWIGQRFRARLSETHFRRLFFLALIGLGLYIIWNAAAGALEI
jgi:uncharacterized membrane protein YfcA